MIRRLCPSCDRACLYAALDSYLAALKARDPQAVRRAARVRNTENNVELRIGDGLWGTITDLGAYDLRFADLQEGQVGLYGVAEESGDRSPFALRLKVANGAVAEVELIVTRKPESGTPFHSADLVDKAVMN